MLCINLSTTTLHSKCEVQRSRLHSVCICLLVTYLMIICDSTFSNILISLTKLSISQE
ncbi:hypothetical protein HanIR_Chr01g0008491 [Helianthus annuus]|nr:hypothetical protein HanIR_Chr01g0008491 [Helianthus annuus]